MQEQEENSEKKNSAVDENTKQKIPTQNAADFSVLENFDSSETYQHTFSLVDELMQKDEIYAQILQTFREGSATAKVHKRVMLRAIDETWVAAVEDVLPALDAIIRNPSRTIEEEENVLPIELTRNISSRSIKHLSQHTDYIAKIDGDEITPSKILNVFREETLLTYENKFINTLLWRLYTFVRRRFSAAKENPQDTKSVKVEFNNQFTQGEVKGKISFSMELETPESATLGKNYFYDSDLWKRVNKLNDICSSYMSSEFVATLGKNYIRPPVMHTNALLKNKNLRQCLTLWEFIESYENVGYSTTVQEDLEKLDDDYVKELYSTLAVQYVLFRCRMKYGFDKEKELVAKTTSGPFYPRFVEEISPISTEEFDVKEQKTEIPFSENDERIVEAVRVALDADEIMRAAEEKLHALDEKYEKRLRRSFLANLIQAKESVKENYAELKNELLSYKKIKSRMSWGYESYHKGRTKCAKMNIRGKTLTLYLALDPNAFEKKKYHQRDFSSIKKYSETPFGLKIKSGRALKYAKELIGILMEKFGFEKSGNYENIAYPMPYETTAELITRGLIKNGEKLLEEKKEAILVAAKEAEENTNRIESAEKIEITPLSELSTISEQDKETEKFETSEQGKEAEQTQENENTDDSEEMQVVKTDTGEIIRYNRSFKAKLIQSETTLKENYAELKNELLSYKKIKSRMSWGYESYHKGRTKCAKMNIRGKTLTLYLALDPNAFEKKKYHQRDFSSIKKYSETPFALKIKSGRALKYAKELIGALMQKMSVVSLEKREVINETISYLDTDTLIEQGWIHKFQVVESKAVFPSLFEKKQKVDDVICSLPVIKEEMIKEEIIKEEPAEKTIEKLDSQTLEKENKEPQVLPEENKEPQVLPEENKEPTGLPQEIKELNVPKEELDENIEKKVATHKESLEESSKKRKKAFLSRLFSRKK